MNFYWNGGKLPKAIPILDDHLQQMESALVILRIVLETINIIKVVYYGYIHALTVLKIPSKERGTFLLHLYIFKCTSDLHLSCPLVVFRTIRSN